MQYNPDFLIIPYLLILDSSITPLDKQIYGIIYWAAKLRSEKCTMTNQTIADLLQAKVGSIKNSLSRLSKRKYISVIQDEQSREILPLVFFGIQPVIVPSLSNDSPSLNNAKPSLSNDAPIVYINNNINKNIRKKNSEELNEVSSVLCRKKTVADQCGHCAYCSRTVMSKEQLYQVALEEKVAMSSVSLTYNSLINQVKSGEFKHKTVYFALKNWINMGKERGTIKEIDGFELDVMKLQHDPAYIAKMKEAEALAIKAGLL